MRCTICLGLLLVCHVHALAWPPAVARSPDRATRRTEGLQATPSPGIEVVNAAGKSLHLDDKTIKQLPSKKLEIKDAASKVAVYEGVPLNNLLEKGGIKIESELRGARLANYLLVQAKDGYRVVFALPEIDPAMNDNLILLAHTKDGVALNEKEGPYRILMPHEKQHARWVRQVTKISELTSPNGK